MFSINTRISHLQPLLFAAFLCMLSTCSYALNMGKIGSNEIAFYVANLDTGQEVVAHRADIPMNPASTMKLLTSFAALSELGAAYTWQTEFRSAAPIVQGVLEGDLYWVGSGDPLFDQEDLISLQNQLLAKGIRGINGRLLLDRSIWSHVGSADHFEGDSKVSFTTPPDPQLVAFKVAWLHVDMKPNGAQIKLEPALPNVNLHTQIGTRKRGHCVDIRNYLNIKVLGKTVNVTGQLPPSCHGKKAFVNVLDGQTFAIESFLAHWQELGGTPPKGSGKGLVPEQAKILATHRSKPLSEVLLGINKYSNNTMARTVFLTLGQHESKSPNTVASAERALRRSFVKASLQDDETLVIENGSGLSRKERVTPRFMGQMLYQAYQSPFASAFVKSLPIGGYDGTLRNRFKNLKGSMYLKTGTLANVRALGGYYLPLKGGNPLIIVVMINGPKASGQLADMDQLVNEIVRTYG